MSKLYSLNVAYLVRCPAGTHYDALQEKCANCKSGTYQNQEGKFECDKCPPGTWTLGDDKKNFTACRGRTGAKACSYAVSIFESEKCGQKANRERKGW